MRRPARRIARILAVARLETLGLLRDRTSISLLFLVPAIQIVLFGYAVNLDPKPVQLAIARDGDSSAGAVRRVVDASGYFRVVADHLAPGEATTAVEEGRALVGIELPPPLDYDDPEAPIQKPRVVVDASDPGAVRPALAALERAWWRHSAGRRALAAGDPVEVQWLYNPEGRTAWTIVPGLIGAVVMISMLMLGALSLVRERERGSWETLLATPVDALDALVGKLAPCVALGALQAGVVLAVARFLFDLPASGSLAALLLAMPLYAAAHLALGFAFSALAESQLQAIQGAVFFYLPSMLLSGFLFPFEGMPAWARAIGEGLPLTHAVRATRGVLLKGEGAAFVAAEMLPVAAFAAAASAVALIAYRRRID